MTGRSEAPRIGELLSSAAARVGRLEAELLLGRACNLSRTALIAHPERRVDALGRAAFAHLLESRARGAPIAHLIGRREFWSLDLHVDPSTLIPRPETEELVARALEVMAPEPGPVVADLGTGSGAVALALATERPDASVVATDLSRGALVVAERNRNELGRTNVSLCQADWLTPFTGVSFAMIVSNPPYVAEGDPHLRRGDVAAEPRLALLGGPDGLACLEVIAAQSRCCLRRGGWLLLEHGHRQAAAVRGLLRRHGFTDPVTFDDLGGRERVTRARAC